MGEDGVLSSWGNHTGSMASVWDGEHSGIFGVFSATADCIKTNIFFDHHPVV